MEGVPKLGACFRANACLCNPVGETAIVIQANLGKALKKECPRGDRKGLQKCEVIVLCILNLDRALPSRLLL